MAWSTPHTWADGELVTSSILNGSVRDDLAALHGDDAPWTNVTAFQGTWTNQGLPPVMMYRRVGSWVHLNGFITGGTLSTTVFTLPVGFRPSKDVMVFGSGEDSLAVPQKDVTEVFPDGEVQPVLGDAHAFSIFGAFSIL